MKRLALWFFSVSLFGATYVPWLNILPADRRGTVHASQLSVGTAATRPLSPKLGDMYYVTDGTSTSDCTTGGSTNHVPCVWNGSSWTALGSGSGGPATAIQTYTVGTLPSPSTGSIGYVTDGASATDCTTGSGSTKVLCIYNGSSWVGVAGSGSSPVHQFGGAFGTPGGSALSTGGVVYFVMPAACTINGWDILVDAGTATVKFWKIATGTAIPTSSNSINTSGVSISTGTAVHSTTVTDFTSTAVSAHDIGAVTITAVSSAAFVYATFECQ
jgi:hypothetical protein